jgi:hypothetical protein
MGTHVLAQRQGGNGTTIRVALVTVLCLTASSAVAQQVPPSGAVAPQMDRLQFFASIIGSLAWPVVVTTLLAERLEELAFGGAKATFVVCGGAGDRLGQIFRDES